MGRCSFDPSVVDVAHHARSTAAPAKMVTFATGQSRAKRLTRDRRRTDTDWRRERAHEMVFGAQALSLEPALPVVAIAEA